MGSRHPLQGFLSRDGRIHDDRKVVHDVAHGRGLGISSLSDGLGEEPHQPAGFVEHAHRPDAAVDHERSHGHEVRVGWTPMRHHVGAASAAGKAPSRTSASEGPVPPLHDLALLLTSLRLICDEIAAAEPCRTGPFGPLAHRPRAYPVASRGLTAWVRAGRPARRPLSWGPTGPRRAAGVDSHSRRDAESGRRGEREDKRSSPHRGGQRRHRRLLDRPSLGGCGGANRPDRSPRAPRGSLRALVCPITALDDDVRERYLLKCRGMGEWERWSQRLGADFDLRWGGDLRWADDRQAGGAWSKSSGARNQGLSSAAHQ